MRIFARRKPQAVAHFAPRGAAGSLPWRFLRAGVRFVIATLALIIFTLMLAYGAILLKPQAVSHLAQEGLRRLQPHIAPYRLEAQATKLSIATIGGPVLLDVDKMVLSLDAKPLIAVPHSTAQLGFRLLPNPRLILRRLEFTAPLFHAASLQAIPAEPGAPITSRQRWRRFRRAVRHTNRILHFEAVSLAGGKILLAENGEAAGAGPLMAKMNAEITYRRDTLNGTFDMQLPDPMPKDAAEEGDEVFQMPEAPTSSITLRLLGNPDTGNATLSGQAKNIVFSSLRALALPEWLAGLEMPLNAEMKGGFSHEHLTRMNIALDVGAGDYRWPQMFPEPLPVRKMSALVEIDPDLAAFHIRQAKILLPEVTLHADLDLPNLPDGLALQGTAGFDHLPTDRLAQYWPLLLAPMTREWAVTNLHSGHMDAAEAKIAFTPYDLTQEVLREESLSAQMQAEGIQVRYLPDHAPVTDVTGTMHFTGRSMTLDIDHGNYLSATHIGKGTLTIPDFHAAETTLQTEFDISTVAPDVAKLFATPEINLAKKLNLSATAGGSAEGHVKLDALIFSSLPKPPPGYFVDNFKYEVQAKTKSLSQSQFMHETDITHADLDIFANTKKLTIEGALYLFGVPAKLRLDSSFETDISTTEVRMDLPVEKLPAFGYHLEGLAGSLGVTASILQKPGAGDKTTAHIDLTKTALSLPQASIEKSRGTPGTLLITTQTLDDHGVSLETFSLEAPDIKLRGKGVLTPDGDVQVLDISEISSGRQQAAVRYEQTKTGLKLRAKGESLDLIAWRKHRDEEAAKKPKQAGNPLDPGAMDIELDLQKIWLAPETPIYNLKGSFRCSTEKCESVNLSGDVPASAGGKDAAGKKETMAPFSLTIAGNPGARLFDLNATDGGRLLNALDVSDHIKGGKTRIQGRYADDKAGHPLTGTLQSTEFYLQKAPLLTRVLSLTSPGGIVNSLSGKGIGFDRFLSDFTFRDGTIELRNARANGSALGFTTEGSVQLGSTELKLEGTVVPAYMLNSAIGKIPLVGELLVGGKGEGIIATNYSVGGTYDDPKVRVNPLSMLTPGFLRGLFDIFDAKKPAEPAVKPIAPAALGGSNTMP